MGTLIQTDGEFTGYQVRYLHETLLVYITGESYLWRPSSFYGLD